MTNRLRSRLRAGDTTYGLWVTLADPTVTEIAVAMGVDWICIDTEHGHLDHGEVMGHLRAVRGTATTALVRVTEISQGQIKRALDMGAHGVVLPLVRGRADVEAGFAHGRYPPVGRRGVGGERAVKWGLGFDEYLACANDELLIIPLIETREAVSDIDAILAVPGLEAIFFGPADLSASYGHLGAWEGPGVAERILAVTAKARARGIAAGVVGRSHEDMGLRRDQGFRMIAHGSECGLLIRALGASIEARLGTRPVHLWF